MPLQPSRRDTIGPPPRDVSDLAAVVRHQDSYLRQLDPGMLGGRFATPRPVSDGPADLVGGDEGGGSEAESVLGWDEDRLILADLGTQVWSLSYTPISETLHLRWHPDGGSGEVWMRGEHYDLAEDDLIVTIYAEALASAKAEVGDVFSAQYLRVDGGDDDPVEPPPETAPGPATAAVRGTTSGHYGSSDPITTLALPEGTVEGDLIAVTTNCSITDSRVTQVGGSHLWMGFATTLADLDVDMSGAPSGRWVIACMTLETDAVSWTAGSTASDASMTGGDAMNVPQIPGVAAAVCALYDTHAVVDGATVWPTGYTEGGDSGSGKQHVRVDLWAGTSLGTSPAGPAAFHGGHGGCDAVVVGLIGP